MTGLKMVWRCRCGKRVEKLTDDNFGNCGCSDPVYGPEYFYMTTECADMLDEMDTNYSQQRKELEKAQLEITRLRTNLLAEKEINKLRDGTNNTPLNRRASRLLKHDVVTRLVDDLNRRLQKYELAVGELIPATEEAKKKYGKLNGKVYTVETLNEIEKGN